MAAKRPDRSDDAATRLRRMRRRLGELPFVKGSHAGWDLTFTAQAYEVQQRRDPKLSLNDFVTRHGAPSSALYEQTRDHNLVMWHGTTAERAELICKHGFAHFKGVWMDKSTKIPFSFAHSRTGQHGGVPAIVISVIDTQRFAEGHDYYWEINGHVLVFQHNVPPDVVQYQLTDESFEFVGDKSAPGWRPTRRARFVRRGGKWVAPGKNPAYFDKDHRYRNLAEWLDLFVAELLEMHGPLQAIEIFSALYANCIPRHALSRQDIIEAVVRHGHAVSSSKNPPIAARQR